MYNRDHLIFKETEGQEASLSVCLTRILSGQRKAMEDLLSVHKVDAMLAQVGATFRLVPTRT